MIIWGSRGMTSVKGSGKFHCFSCGSEQDYVLKKVEKYFTLYFIPLFPLETLGEYVECKQCRNTFNPKALNYDPQAENARFEAEYHKAIRRVMAGVMLADGVIKDEEVGMIKNVYQKITDSELSVEEIQKEVDELQAESMDFFEGLKRLEGSLNDHGKEMVVKAAMLVAVADSEFHQEERKLVESIGTSLGMTKSHLNGVIVGFMDE